MSIKRNIVASYVSQIYVTLIGIVMVPLYVRHMGAEAYGLVGFFSMLQAWFQLLDVGMTPTMARETARYQGGATDASSVRRLLRALEVIFVGIAVLGAVLLVALSGHIATRWLNVQHLSLLDVERSLQLIAGVVAMRWVAGLYRSAITGFERLVWLGYFNIGIATMRFVLVLPFIIYVSNSPVAFFAYQLAIAVVELSGLAIEAYRLMPLIQDGSSGTIDWKPLRSVLKFSLSIAVTSSVWVMVTQTDKLLLSKLLSLTDYAHYTLAVLVASGVTVVSGPISNALLPRLTRIAASGDEVGLYQLYRGATQFVTLISIPAALVLTFFADKVLWVWTGDRAIADASALVLRLYALGNGVLAVAAFPYYLQYAKGDMRLHLIGNVLFVAMLIPSLLYATFAYGMTGAGAAWLGSNALYLLVWVPLIHRRFAPGLHVRWLRDDICAITLVTGSCAWLAHALLPWPEGRMAGGVLIVALSAALVLVAASCASQIRQPLQIRLRAWSMR